MEDSEVFKIPKDDFVAIVYKNRDVAIKFINMLSNNIMEKEHQLLSLAYNTVRKRVAEALLMLQTRYRDNDKRNLHIAINRDDLAGIAGTASESVVRSLSEFKADKLIAVDGREIVILDAKGLEAIP